jgi:hypothetical protein
MLPWRAMRSRSPILAVLISCAGVCAPLEAQQHTVPDSGARIRVTIAGVFRQSPFGSRTERLEGIVRSISADTLSLALSPAIAPIAIPRSSVRAVEISLGPSARGHAFLGGAIGGTFFGLRMYVVNQEPETRRFASNWQAGVVGGALGFALGAWIGSRIPNERWRTVRLRD